MYSFCAARYQMIYGPVLVRGLVVGTAALQYISAHGMPLVQSVELNNYAADTFRISKVPNFASEELPSLNL